MLLCVRWPGLALLVALAMACGARTTPPDETPTPRPPTALPGTVSPAPAPTSSPAPAPVRVDIRASRLAIPALGIDADVQASQIIPDTSPPTPGCPPRPPGGTTLTVPDQGIATPEDNLEGLENKAWLFGHSRWQSRPGLFFRLQDISMGDELFVDGLDRRNGMPLVRRRFVVDGIYLTDIDSGDRLITADSPAKIPATPVVILQTSVREDGANRQWLLNQQQLLAKARNLIEGDLDDPCKYLLLFVFARSS